MFHARVSYIAVLLSTSLVCAQMPQVAPGQQPVVFGQKPAVAQPAKPFGSQTVAPAPGVQTAIAPQAPMTSVVGGADIKSSLGTFQQLFAAFNATTPAATLQQYITQFLTTVVSVAQTSSTITVDDMNSVKTLIDQLTSVLANINNSLANQPAEAQKRSMITQTSVNLRTQSTQLGIKLEKNKKVMMQLTQTRGVANTQFPLKLSQYTTLLPLFDATIVDPVKAVFVSDMYALMNYAKASAGTALNDLKQFLTKAQAVASFSPQIKAQLASIAAGQAPASIGTGTTLPTSMPTTTATAQSGTGAQTAYIQMSTGATTADAAFQAKLKEVMARTSIVEKTSGAQELLILAGATPSLAIKNSLIGLANQLFASPATMTKQELMGVHDLLVKIAQHPFMLSQNQKPAVESWVKLSEQALPFADATGQLLVGIKARMGQYQQAYGQAIQAALLAMKLLATKLIPQEVDKANQSGLVGILRQNLVAYYNARANKSLDDLKGLLELLTLASKRSNLADVVQRRWIDGLNLGIALTTAEGKTAVLDKVAAYDTASALMQSMTDRSDKSRFLDGLNSLFINRKDFAQTEIDALRALVTKLLAPLYKRKMIFDSSQTTQLTSSLGVLDATSALFAARSAELMPKLALLTKVIPLIDLKTMGYEQQLFVSNLNDLFAARGDMMRNDLAAVVSFFTAAMQQGQKTGNLLTPDQLATLVIWTQEEQVAQATATNDKSYLAAVIDQCVQTKNLQLVQKAITLFTKNTSSTVKLAFAIMLEGLFTARKTLNPTDLQKTFMAVDAQKLAVLPPEKRDNPRNWLQIIGQEIIASASAQKK